MPSSRVRCIDSVAAAMSTMTRGPAREGSTRKPGRTIGGGRDLPESEMTGPFGGGIIVWAEPLKYALDQLSR